MTTCTSPATDGTQGATYGAWVLQQDSNVVSEFDLTIDGAPVPDWGTRLPVVEVWDGTAMLTIAGGNIIQETQPTSTDSTKIQVEITAAQTATPTITGWYRIGTTDAAGDGFILNRYGPWYVRRNQWDGSTLP